jgi:hypothetical protein
MLVLTRATRRNIAEDCILHSPVMSAIFKHFNSLNLYIRCKIRGFHGGDYEEWCLGMLRRVALVRTDVSEELSASIRVTRIGELGTTLAGSISSQRASVVSYI